MWGATGQCSKGEDASEVSAKTTEEAVVFCLFTGEMETRTRCGCRGGCMRSGECFASCFLSWVNIVQHMDQKVWACFIYLVWKKAKEDQIRGSLQGAGCRRNGDQQFSFGRIHFEEPLDIQVGIWRYLLVNPWNLGRDWGWRVTFRHHAG